MTQLYTLLGDELVNALGWTFVHSLWQGSLIALMMTAVLSQIPSQQARRRYRIATLSLISVLLCSAITFILLYQQPIDSVSGSDVIVSASEVTSETTPIGLYAWISQFTPFLVSIWITGVLFFALRFCFGLGYLQHLRSHTTPVSGEWQESLNKIVQTLRFKRPVQLAQSALIRIPVVAGYFKPVILFPVGIINQLHIDEVEAILAHEVAHLVRNDFLQNLVQSLIEMVFYYHPAVWWISAVVRSERENCCDDLAMQICTNSFTYAKALVRLEDMSYRAPALALPFAGSKGHLLNRIKRILNQPQTKSNVMERIIATVILIGCVTLLSFTEKSAQAQPDDTFLTEYQYTNTDSVPTQRNITVMKTVDGKDIEMRSENGEIMLLKINGELIEPSAYPAHEAEIEEMTAIAEKAPELPPMPPMAPEPPEPPVPPVPPMPAMPEPPELMFFEHQMPPRPSDVHGRTNKTTIIREKSGKGYSYHVESDGSGSAVMIDGDRGIATINGQEIELDADSVIVIEAIELNRRNQNASNGYFFVPGNNANAPEFDFNHNYQFDIAKGGESWSTGDSLRRFKYRISGEPMDDQQKAEWKAYEQQMQAYGKQMDGEEWKQYAKELKDNAASWQIEYGDQMKEYQQQMQEYAGQLAEVERESARDAQQRNREIMDRQRERQTEARLLFRDQTDRDRMLENQNGDVILLERNGTLFSPSPEFFRHQPFGPITSAMDREGLIDADGEYKIILEEDKLRINGKRQSDELHQKYMDLFKRTQGYAISGKTKIEISNDQ